MPLTDQDREALISRTFQVFTPATPIDSKDLFAGRLAEVRRFIEAIRTPGMHTVLYGERGVGKTSLANVIEEFFAEPGMEMARVQCDEQDNFHSIMVRALDRVSVQVREPQVGFGSDGHQTTDKLSRYLPPKESCRPSDVADLIARFDQTMKFPVMILDEFDRVTDPTTKAQIADLIKGLSDARTRLRVAVVGIANDVANLIANHASLDRCLCQIRIPEMSRDELEEIIEKGARAIGVSFEQQAAETIVTLSHGFPHYTHLLAKASLLHALRMRRSTTVQHSDLDKSYGNTIADVSESIRSAYQMATRTTGKKSLLKSILYAAALAPTDEHGTFRPSDLIAPLSTTHRKKMALNAFFSPLSKLSSPERGNVLTRIGARRPRYRFTNPLMRPYILIVARTDPEAVGPIPRPPAP